MDHQVRSYIAVGMNAHIPVGPEATGFDVARFARRVIPDLFVIYMSGATTNASLDAFGVPGGEFLQKPFRPQALLGPLT